MKTQMLVAGAMLALVAPAGVMAATPLLPAVYETSVVGIAYNSNSSDYSGGDPNIYIPNASYFNYNPSFGSFKGSAITVAAPNTGSIASASAYPIAGELGGVTSQTYEYYYFEVVGPGGPYSNSVPIVVDAKVTASGSGADTGVSGSIGDDYGTVAELGAPGSVSVAKDQDVASNVVLTMTLRSEATVWDGGSGTVSVDPFIFIDPTFLAENPGYSLDFSPAVGNSPSGVPEPATWATMLLGVGMIGAGLRMARRKNDIALTAA
jgi:hypothetical protein